MSYEVKVILDGNKYDIKVAEGETILEAAINANIDPPYACRVAACCSCKAKLIDGKVEMDDDEPLTEEELDEGFILTCQSHPKTNCTINYDEA
ncbi:MAG TPA: 2Fe-2S iron-sulfur cluster-binding protein [Chitinophagales bacterium]|nr:2Fe-2S iron-sulfur cluster-binding protein [Chitinophagales bacterium]HMW12391.1 2Fe-2S iron-sulfur cluster-binding protein [Chitinophagales bacterium]HMX60052.1 2Fe-2S iron-sulfur cluster-binding protein [Chitinophagales bacterium]HMY24416.1 2Fe-2S iron-sulfur cluster-binding protein [Chitinophagales bacterium]HMZ34227.1 2Fe-2S iron-sulfur cluster-binding protein [Chitinophagales bacterium]